MLTETEIEEIHHVEHVDLRLDERCFESLLDELEFEFKRIADNHRLLVGHTEFEIAINKLIVDDRGGRQGFPPKTMSLLLKLSKLHTEKFGHLLPQTDPWHNGTFK